MGEGGGAVMQSPLTLQSLLKAGLSGLNCAALFKMHKGVM